VRVSRTVLWEGEGAIPLPDPIVANLRKTLCRLINMTKEEILDNVKKVDGLLGGMTVNERLYATGYIR
jgi:hypothetical protein